MSEYMNYGHTHLLSLESVGIQSGLTDVIAASSSSVTKVDITFPKAYTEAPCVVVGFYTNSTNKVMGNMSCSCYNLTTTGFELRIFNNSSTTLNPRVTWAAFGKF